MGKSATPPAQDATAEKPSFFSRAKQKISRFFKVAIGAAPMTLLYSGLAFAGSAVVASMGGPDLLHVTDNSTGLIIRRLLGSMALGGAISAGVDLFNNSGACGDEPCNIPVPGVKSQHSNERTTQPAMSHSPPLHTPVVPRGQQGLGVQ